MNLIQRFDIFGSFRPLMFIHVFLSFQLREAQTRLEELSNQNKHLQNRIDKMKQARALASQ